MSRIRKNNDVRLNVLISKELKKNYKLKCLKEDIIMSDRIRELIEKDLKETEILLLK